MTLAVKTYCVLTNHIMATADLQCVVRMNFAAAIQKGSSYTATVAQVDIWRVVGDGTVIKYIVQADNYLYSKLKFVNLGYRICAF